LLAISLSMPAGAASSAVPEETAPVAETAMAKVPVPKARPAIRKRTVASPYWRRWSAPPVYRPAPPLPRVAVMYWPLMLGIGY
jgi:hypothetical protein